MKEVLDKESIWRRLVGEINNCRKCPLYKYRKKPVPGEGNLDAEIMFIGEAPGAHEDETGRPFVGAAGNLLTRLLNSIGLKRGEVFITNIVKCRPPNNRDPSEDEINACLPYLIEQIKLVKPKIIVALGRHAARTLFRLAGLKWTSMRQMHGRVFEGSISGVNVKIFVTYHPAAALYYPKLRPELKNDFRKLKKLVESLHTGQTTGRSILDYFSQP